MPPSMTMTSPPASRPKMSGDMAAGPGRSDSEELEQGGVDFDEVGPADVVRAALDGDQLEILD